MKEFLIAIILTICIVHCDSCTCNPKYINKPKARYCLAAYGIKAKVLNTANSGQIRPGPFGTDRRYYRIQIKKFLKLKPAFNKAKIDKKWVHTANDSAACGVLLQKGKTYLLAGSIFQHPTPRPRPGGFRSRFAPKPKKDELMINACQVVSLWKDIRNNVIPGFNIKFVKKTYKTRCAIILAPTDIAVPG